MREFVAEIGGLQLRIQAEESLFSPDGLDAGTRCMLEMAELSAPLLDLGCGSGIVGIYAAKSWERRAFISAILRSRRWIVQSAMPLQTA